MTIPKVRQLPSGNYFTQLRIKGQSISITDADEDVVKAKAYAYKVGLLKARKTPEDITLREACERYIDRKEKVERLSPTTIQGYRVIVENRYPRLMEMKLSAITPAVFKAENEDECTRISPRTGKPLAPKSLENAYFFVVTILGEYMPGETFDAKLPEEKKKPIQILTPEQIYPLIKGTEIELPCLLSMWMSLSMSEIRGLTKSKSLRNGQLTIVESVVDVHGKPVRKDDAKEELRTRTLTVPEHIQRLFDAVDGDVIVPLSAQTITKRFYRLLDKAGLPHINFHKLRHINASVMVELGIPEKEAQARGGWKTEYIFKQVYAHAFDRQRVAADAAMDDYFEQVVNANANEDANGGEESA